METRRTVYVTHVGPVGIPLPIHSSSNISDMNLKNMLTVDGRSKTTLAGIRNVLIILVGLGGEIIAAIYLPSSPPPPSCNLRARPNWPAK